MVLAQRKESSLVNSLPTVQLADDADSNVFFEVVDDSNRHLNWGVNVAQLFDQSGGLIKATALGGTGVTGTSTVTSASANALAVGRQGATSPAFNVDASAATVVTGLNVAGAAAGGGVAVSAIGGNAAEALSINAEGAGALNLGNTSTGIITLGRGAKNAVVFGSTKATLSAQNVTPTAAQLLGGVVEHVSATGAGTFTLDTAANLDTAVTAAANGDTFECLVANTGNQTSTITTANGLTLKGTVAIPTLKNAILTFFRTGTGTWTVYCTVSA